MDIELQTYKSQEGDSALFDDLESVTSNQLHQVNEIAGNSTDLEAYMNGIEYTADTRRTRVFSNLGKKVGLLAGIVWLLTLLFYTFTR